MLVLLVLALGVVPGAAAPEGQGRAAASVMTWAVHFVIAPVGPRAEEPGIGLIVPISEKSKQKILWDNCARYDRIPTE